MKSIHRSRSLIRKILKLIVNFILRGLIALRFHRATSKLDVKIGDVDIGAELGDKGSFYFLAED